ncbi:MAG: hypothetical protein R3E72_10485 [Steroidobacteraceae bacterium]
MPVCLSLTKTGELSVRVDELVATLRRRGCCPTSGMAWRRRLRYRQRYVDLTVNDESRAIFQTRTRIAVRDGFLDALDFQEARHR